MTDAEARQLVAVLAGAYPNRKNASSLTDELFRLKLEKLDYQLARDAISDLIDDQKFWPAWSELRALYDEHANARRTAQQRAELDELLAEPTDDEKREQLALMQQYVTTCGALHDPLHSPSFKPHQPE